MERCGDRVDLEEVDPIRARVEGVHELVGIYLGPLRLDARPCPRRFVALELARGTGKDAELARRGRVEEGEVMQVPQPRS